MPTKIILSGLWDFLQYPISIIAVYQIVKWLLLLTPFGKRFAFRWKIHKLAHANRELFWSHNNYSVLAYLNGNQVGVESNILSDWWNYAFSTPPTLFSLRSPEELICIINSALNMIKKAKENSKHPQYQQMALRVNDFCGKLEDISKQFPGLCRGLSCMERLPLA